MHVVPQFGKIIKCIISEYPGNNTTCTQGCVLESEKNRVVKDACKRDMESVKKKSRTRRREKSDKTTVNTFAFRFSKPNRFNKIVTSHAGMLASIERSRTHCHWVVPPP